jgi:hypothetical protein
MSKPFLPSERPRPRIGESHSERAIFAAVKAAIDPQMRGAEKIAKQRFPGDEVTPLYFRSASVPADTAAGNWASALAPDMVADFQGLLQPSQRCD